MTMATTIQYEKITCGRCGGSGSYSYCTMYGSTCFQCGGRKRVLSRAGSAALAAVRAFIAANFSVLVDDLKPGDRISYDGKGRTVAEVSTDSGSRYSIGKDADGNHIWEDYISVRFTKPVASMLGPCDSHGYCKGTKVVRAVGGADWDQVVAFARTLTRGVTLLEK
jgi:hypothetical protein